MRLLKDSYFLAVALNHMAVDILNSQKALLLVFLAPSLGFTNADIGLLALIYSGCGSLTQPLFGWLADRYQILWMSACSLLWLAVCYSLFILLPGRWAIAGMLMGALGSAAFHASGTERATSRGEILMIGRAATAASLFFLFGLAGHSLGPAIGGALLEKTGKHGLLIMAAVTVPVALNSFYRLYFLDRFSVPETREQLTRKSKAESGFRRGKWVLVAFAILVLLRGVPQMTSMTFLPKLFQDRGYTPGSYGLMASVHMAGVALGGVAGGFLADRWGRRKTILWTLLASTVPMYYYPVMTGNGLEAMVFLAGALIGASFSVLVVLSQELLPSRRALASGLTLGFMFASGSIGSYLFGLAADIYPLASVMQINSVLCVMAALLTFTLKRDSKATERVSPTKAVH